MGIVIKPNAVNQAPKGTVLFTEGQSIQFIIAILKGRVLTGNKGTRVTLGSGCFLGVNDLYLGHYLCSCVAADDVMFFAFPVEDKSGIRKILESNKDYRGLMAGSLSKYVNELALTWEAFRKESDKLYRFVKEQFKQYTECGKNAGIRTNNMPAVAGLAAPETESSVLPERLVYYRECAKIPLEVQKSFYSYGCEVAFCHIEEQAGIVAQLMTDCIAAEEYLREAFLTLMNDGEQNLFLNIAKLAYDMQSAGKDNAPLLKMLDAVIDEINVVERLFLEKTNQQITVDRERMENLYCSLLSNENPELGNTAGELDVAGQYEDSLGQILTYSGLPPEKTAEFEAALEEFRAMPDKLSTEDVHRKLRRRIADGFYLVYEAVFLKAYEEKGILPKPVELFLNFGFVDERLLSVTQLMDLHSLVIEPVEEDPSPVYTIREWLTAVYEGKKAPSKNEFDLEYTEMLREMKKNGQINVEQEAEYAKDSLKKLEYEIQNMFRYNLRLVNGQISTFVPVLYGEMFINSVERSFVTKTMMNDAVKRLRAIDYSLFARELLYVNKELHIEKEYQVKEVFPDIILMPTYGFHASMWQDISCKRRDLPGRFLFPMFTDTNLDDLMIRTCGKYRWELCRSVQGMAWNSIQYKSLTSEYYDYLMYFKKNKDLTEERKEKIKLQMQKGKNNYREVFAMDYENWIKGEAAGAMKLNKVVREIMATYCPFEKSIRLHVQMQPVFEEAMARQRRELAKKIREIELRYHALTKEGIELPEELVKTLAYYKDN